jgi:hypothetical protein|tara:strand:+ start:42 stop:212 length:171 start_codon:yes stop_codon:yes gene_type:complete
MAQIIGNNGGNVMSSEKTIASSTTLSGSYNHMSIGPITINSGVTVTISSNATWTVI